MGLVPEKSARKRARRRRDSHVAPIQGKFRALVLLLARGIYFPFPRFYFPLHFLGIFDPTAAPPSPPRVSPIFTVNSFGERKFERTEVRRPARMRRFIEYDCDENRPEISTSSAGTRV